MLNLQWKELELTVFAQIVEHEQQQLLLQYLVIHHHHLHLHQVQAKGILLKINSKVSLMRYVLIYVTML